MAATPQTPPKPSAKFSCEQVARAKWGEPAKREGPELLYHCPHGERHKDNDSHPSLAINPKKDMWGCFVCDVKGKGGWSLAAFIIGCDPGDKARVVEWLVAKDLLPKRERKAKGKAEHGPCVAVYLYTDAQGNPVARKLRFEPGANGRKKDFAWERWENAKWVSGLGNVKTPLYRIATIINEPFVVLTEGCKDADAGAGIGLPTATSGGVGSWREDHAECLRDRHVVVIADADEAGRIHAQKVAASLYGKVRSVRVSEIPEARDLADAIEQGWPSDDLLMWFNSEPEWKPPSGAEILDSVTAFVRRFVCMSEAQARVVALWVAHTYAFEVADSTPYLHISSPEKQTGKTRLLEALEKIVMNPWLIGRTTAAALVRNIDGKHSTLLLDESDTAFKQEKEYVAALRGILNTGYRKSGKASLCVGQGAAIEVRDFQTFSPKGVAGIGRLPDTVEDRSLPIKLRRARRGAVARFREREAAREGSDLAARLAAWATANLGALREARPAIPSQLTDRQADCCEPLLGIADLASGDWPKAARTALVELCGAAQLDDDSIGVKLLRDIKGVFAGQEVAEMPSAKLCEALAQIETSPWGDWHGKPITPMRLAALLKPFEIFPGQIQNGTARGYALAQFRECFSLYLPPQGVKVSETRENSSDEEVFKVSKEKPCDTLQNAVSPNKDAASRHLDTLKAGGERQGEGEKATQPFRFQEDKGVLEV